MIDFFGRKIALMLTALPFSVGWLMIGFGKVAGLLHAGRFLSGVGVGCASLIVPVSNEYLESFSLLLGLLEVWGEETANRGECRRSRSYLASAITLFRRFFSFHRRNLLLQERETFLEKSHSKFPKFSNETFSPHNLCECSKFYLDLRMSKLITALFSLIKPLLKCL